MDGGRRTRRSSRAVRATDAKSALADFQPRDTCSPATPRRSGCPSSVAPRQNPPKIPRGRQDHIKAFPIKGREQTRLLVPTPTTQADPGSLCNHADQCYLKPPPRVACFLPRSRMTVRGRGSHESSRGRALVPKRPAGVGGSLPEANGYTPADVIPPCPSYAARPLPSSATGSPDGPRGSSREARVGRVPQEEGDDWLIGPCVVGSLPYGWWPVSPGVAVGVLASRVPPGPDSRSRSTRASMSGQGVLR